MMAGLSFCVVIPMYNEEAGVEACVKKVTAVLSQLSYKNALIVINDGSKDKTGDILAKVAVESPGLVVITHEKNKGYGAALKTGTYVAKQKGFKYVLFMDSDLTNDPGDIPKFVQKMVEGIDVIKASRYTGSGRMEGVPLKRMAFSKMGNMIASPLFGVGIKDCTNGFRAVKVDILIKMNLTERGFPVIMQELYYSKYLARTFCEIPVVLTNRKTDQRPTAFVYKPGMFQKYLKYAVKAFLGIRPSATVDY
jgi:dolichol-phosphate mannosyltransferase